MEDKNIDQFERFLKGKMKGAEKLEFERELHEDEQLQKQFSAFILANDVVEQEVRNDLKSKMDSWESPGNRSRSGVGVVSIILFALMGIAAVSIIWLCPQEEEQQWDQYAEVNVEALQRAVGTSDAIRQLNQYYITGNYAMARQMIDQMKPGLKEHAEVQFIQALLKYQNKDFQHALSIFALLKGEEDIHFAISDQAQYYYNLTLIRMNDCTQECIKELKEIAKDGNHLRQNEAKELINDLSL